MADTENDEVVKQLIDKIQNKPSFKRRTGASGINCKFTPEGGRSPAKLEISFIPKRQAHRVALTVEKTSPRGWKVIHDGKTVGSSRGNKVPVGMDQLVRAILHKI